MTEINMNVGWGSDGETITRHPDGKQFRAMEVVEDNPELLAQGRFAENAARKRRLNALPVWRR